MKNLVKGLILTFSLSSFIYAHKVPKGIYCDIYKNCLIYTDDSILTVEQGNIIEATNITNSEFVENKDGRLIMTDGLPDFYNYRKNNTTLKDFFPTQKKILAAFSGNYPIAIEVDLAQSSNYCEDKKVSQKLGSNALKITKDGDCFFKGKKTACFFNLEKETFHFKDPYLGVYKNMSLSFEKDYFTGEETHMILTQFIGLDKETIVLQYKSEKLNCSKEQKDKSSELIKRFEGESRETSINGTRDSKYDSWDSYYDSNEASSRSISK